MVLKSSDDIAAMRRAGLVLWDAHQVAAQMMEVGVSTLEIDRAVDDFIVSCKGVPMFKGVPGVVPYPAATCISINEQVVHGIPADRRLAEGDAVSIDIGVRLDGWCADAAVTWPIGEVDEEVARLLEVTEETLRYAIGRLDERVRWSSIARQMQKMAETAGFSVVEELVGHGIGQEMWEEPQVPNYPSRHLSDFRLQPGLTLAIEPMVNAGTRKVVGREDHWTIATRDGRPSAHFEHTVAVTEEGPLVLTCGPDGEGWGM